MHKKINVNSVISRLKKGWSGFTLIEVLVVVGILGILITLVVVAINPASQLRKTRDTQRASDLKAVQTALEAYRVANNIYPLSTTDNQITGASWGGNWAGYLSNVPRDPLVSRTYTYVSLDGTNYQLYADFEGTPPDSLACGAGCGPDGLYDSGVASGNSTLQTFTPAPTVTPTPTPVPLPSGKVIVFVSQNSNPKFVQFSFDPYDPASGQSQTIDATIWDSTAPIESASIRIRTDNNDQVYQMSQFSAALVGGTYRDVWRLTNTINDTHNTRYMFDLTATNSNGDSVSTSWYPRDPSSPI